MKPSFALNLSHDGLSLLRRAKGGWQIIGSVALDDTKMAEKLRYLRRTAAELAGGQLSSKLVIPNSEILYKTVDAAGATDAERAEKVRQSLENATPYAVDDLAFDWVDAGNGRAHIAAVARATLAEAEDFAVEHRFNPVSFVAIPEGGTFVGEPFFGETRLCRSLLPSGETVESDPGPIVITGNHDPDSAPETVEPTIEEEAEAAILTQDATLKPADTAKGSAKNTAAKASKPGKKTGKQNRKKNRPKKEPKPDAAPQTPTFSSIREGSDGDQDLPSLERVTARFALYADKVQPDAEPAQEEPAPKLLVTPMPVTAPEIAGRDLPEDLKKQLETIEETPVAPVAKMPKPTPAQAPFVTPAPEIPTPAPEIPTPAPNAKVLIPAAAPPLAATKSTVFDERAPKKAGNGKGVLGMTLGLGLAALILFAVLLSSIFFDRPIALSQLWGGLNNSADLAPAQTLETARISASEIAPVTGADTETGQIDQQVAGTQVAPVAPVAPGGDLSTPNSETALAALAPEGSVPEIAPPVEPVPDTPPLGEITFEEAVVIQASTGVWVLAPNPPVGLETEVLDDFYVASIDPLLLNHDAFALPDISDTLNDFRPGDFFSPAPAGTVFDLDERGFVRPTVEGALSANGVTVFKGRPEYAARPRPTDADWFNAPAALQAQVRDISRKRPTARPDNLQLTNERARLGGRTRNELAAIKPVARPESPQEARANIDLTPTDLAVARSRTPTLRPDNFATTVAVAIAANTQIEVVQAAAAIAPAQIPTIPTTASVAREATSVNAINLSHVNLIGVYGSSGSRRALVRLKSGRYVKVQIGDRLDGGKVAAIDGDKLQYVKGGRMVTLEIAS